MTWFILSNRAGRPVGIEAKTHEDALAAVARMDGGVPSGGPTTRAQPVAQPGADRVVSPGEARLNFRPISPPADSLKRAIYEAGPLPFNGILGNGVTPEVVRTFPALKGVQPPTRRDAARAYGAGGVMDLIANGEGARGDAGYDMTYDFGKYYPLGRPPLRNVTIGEIPAVQEEIRRRGGGRPVGRYQFMPAAFGETRDALNLSPEETFSPQLQDRMARERLRTRGYDDYLSGRISEAAELDKLAKEWASVGGRIGASHYPSQHVGTPREDLATALRRAKAEADRARLSGNDPSYTAWR
jgi:muramidase (phage lysozyme)